MFTFQALDDIGWCLEIDSILVLKLTVGEACYTAMSNGYVKFGRSSRQTWYFWWLGQITSLSSPLKSPYLWGSDRFEFTGLPTQMVVMIVHWKFCNWATPIQPLHGDFKIDRAIGSVEIIRQTSSEQHPENMFAPIRWFTCDLGWFLLSAAWILSLSDGSVGQPYISTSKYDFWCKSKTVMLHCGLNNHFPLPKWVINSRSLAARGLGVDPIYFDYAAATRWVVKSTERLECSHQTGSTYHCLVVWNHGILWLSIKSWEWKHHPNWLSLTPSFFRGVGWNHQPDYYHYQPYINSITIY